MATADCFTFITALHGFHVYHNTVNWNLYIGQDVSFKCELDNMNDKFAVCGKAFASITRWIRNYIHKESIESFSWDKVIWYYFFKFCRCFALRGYIWTDFNFVGKRGFANFYYISSLLHLYCRKFLSLLTQRFIQLLYSFLSISLLVIRNWFLRPFHDFFIYSFVYGRYLVCPNVPFLKLHVI